MVNLLSHFIYALIFNFINETIEFVKYLPLTYNFNLIKLFMRMYTMITTIFIGLYLEISVD